MKEIKKDALMLIKNKAKKNNRLSLIDVWDIELELEEKYKFVKENEIKEIVEDIIFYKWLILAFILHPLYPG